MTSVRLPHEMEIRLEHIMGMTRRSKSFFIKEALEMYLDDIEDGHIALERIMSPRRKFYSSEDVLKKIRSKTRPKK